MQDVEAVRLPDGSGIFRLRSGEALDLATFGPLYIRPSEAELKSREQS